MKARPLLFLLISVMLTSVAWTIPFLSWVNFFSLVPLFLGIKAIQESKNSSFWKLFRYVFFFQILVYFIISNWIYDTSFISYLIAVFFVVASFSLITIPSIYFFSKNKSLLVFYVFIANWMIYEYLSQVSSLMTPFYILGFSLGEYPSLIQNYSLIGIEGGSLWILLTNIGLFQFYLAFSEKVQLRVQTFIPLIISSFLLILSLVVNFSHAEKTDRSIKVAALHTNINHTDPKFQSNPQRMIDSLWNMSSGIKPETELLVWPETIITNLGWVHEFHINKELDSLTKRVESHKNLSLAVGANVFTLSEESDQAANYSTNNNFYYNSHNISLSINPESHKFRSKQKFVSFHENIPYLSVFPWLKSIAPILGNTDFYSKYSKDQTEHFTQSGRSYTPVICYEICYPLFINSLAKDIDFLTLHANEFWNKRNVGIRQYFNCLSTISIQSGIPIVKSANGGVSCIIDGYGRTIAKSQRSNELIQARINLQENQNVYAVIAGYSYVLSAIVLIFFSINFLKYNK